MIVLRINCLGPFQVQWAGKPAERFDTLKNRALLIYLAIEGETALSRDFLAGLLWPNFPNAIALRNLRLALFNLRQALSTQAELPGCLAEVQNPILSSRLTIQFNTRAPVWVDAKEFNELFIQTRKHPHSSLEECPLCIEKLERAASYYHGDFLDGFYLKDAEGFMEWLVLRRAHLQQLMLDGLDQLCRGYLRQAEQASSGASLKRAVENSLLFARRALEIDPVRETAYMHLMKALALQGKKQEALSQFEVCRKILANEIAVEPEEEIIRLCDQIRGDVYPPRAQLLPQARLNSHGRYTLPIQLTPLIGREAQLERLVKLLFSYRWVILVGEGGVGKSRLAITAAEKVAAVFPDGVLFLPLAGVAPAPREWREGQTENRQAVQDTLLKTIAAACDLSIHQDGRDLERLFATIQTRKILLILDNFEHLSSGADILLDLLMNMPQLHILVTTRQSLYFQAGCMMRIDGLPVPRDDWDEEGEQYASVQLFLERVTRLYGDYRYTSENRAWINRICRLLDGIPLAIELAAPWVNKLPLEMIAHAIEHDLDFLANTMPGLLERHHSMRAVFESSWMLLKPGEKRALVCCSAFKDDFSYEEVFEACQASFQEIEGLVDKNLAIKTEPKRYRIHEILRQFVLDKSLNIQLVEMTPRTDLKQPIFNFAAPLK
jgi:DNA-binding SARP family transcriptional activator/predicted ATPase